MFLFHFTFISFCKVIKEKQSLFQFVASSLHCVVVDTANYSYFAAVSIINISLFSSSLIYFSHYTRSGVCCNNLLHEYLFQR